LIPFQRLVGSCLQLWNASVLSHRIWNSVVGSNFGFGTLLSTQQCVRLVLWVCVSKYFAIRKFWNFINSNWKFKFNPRSGVSTRFETL